MNNLPEEVKNMLVEYIETFRDQKTFNPIGINLRPFQEIWDKYLSQSYKAGEEAVHEQYLGVDKAQLTHILKAKFDEWCLFVKKLSPKENEE